MAVCRQAKGMIENTSFPDNNLHNPNGNNPDHVPASKLFGEVVCKCTRAQAITDGVLVDPTGVLSLFRVLDRIEAASAALEPGSVF